MAAQKSLAFAESVVTVHLTLASEPGLLPDGTEAWDIESKIMNPGDTLPLKLMPPYLSEAVREGKVPGLIAMTQAQAKKVTEFYQSEKGLGAAYLESEEQEDDPDFPAEEF